MLIISFAMSPIIVMSARRLDPPFGSRIIWIFVCILGAYIATVLEGILFFDLFNVLEHAFLALTGVLLMLGVIALERQARGRRRP